MDLDHFYLDQKEPNQSCLLALRTIILNHDSNLNETRKYSMPCFCYGKKMFCYLWIDKKTNWPYILMVEGNKLIHQSLVTGDRKRMKVLNINPTTDLPIEIIKAVLNESIQLYKKSIPNHL